MYRWLLVFYVAGHAFRFATEALTISSGSEEVRFNSGLQPLSVGKEFFGKEDLLNVSVTSDDDWPVVWKDAGYSLEGGDAHLYWWKEDTTFESAYKWLSGTVKGAAFGERGESLSFTISRSLQEYSVLSEQAVVDVQTHPFNGSMEEAALGSYYPLVIGYPGGLEFRDNPYGAMPVTVSDRATGFVYAPICDGYIDADQVHVYNSDDGSASDLAVIRGEDDMGRPFSYINVHTIDNSTSEYQVGFRNDAGYGGGIVSQGKVIRGASDVFQYFFERYSGIGLDTGRIQAHKEWINAFKIDTFINDNVYLMEWLEDSVLNEMPVRLMEGSEGVWLSPIRYSAKKTDASIVLTDGLDGVARIGGVDSVSRPIVNELAVSYSNDLTSGRYVSRVLLTSKAPNPTNYFRQTVDPRVLELAVCKESQRRFGVRPENLELHNVWDSSTAIRIGEHYLLENALPRHRLTYSAPAKYWSTDIGQIGLITDASLYLSEALFMVNDVTVSEAEIILEITLL